MIGLGLSLARRRGGGIAAMPAPSLVLDFIANPAIPSGWTFSRATPGSYFGTDGLIHIAAQDIARFDADALTSVPQGLLLEPARTNQLTNSHYDGTRYTVHGTVTRTDGVAAPDGSATASQFVSADMSSGVYIGATTVANTNYVHSTYVRNVADSGGDHSVAIGWDTGQASARFDTVTNLVINKGAAVSATAFQEIRNSWARYSVTYNSQSYSGANCILYGTTNYTYDGWGAQFEQGSYPSSYIDTNGVPVTRAADFLTTGDLSWLNPQAGTIVIDARLYSVADGGVFAFSLDDGSGNGIGIYKALGSGAISAYAGSATGTPLLLTLTDGQRFRAAIAWSGAGASASINGKAAVAVASASAVSPTEFSIGGARTRQFAAHMRVRSLTYWPRRFSDADLAGLTTIPT